MQSVFLLSFQVVVCAYIYCEVLIQPGHIFHGFFKWLTEKLTVVHMEVLPDNAPEEVKSMPGYVPKAVEHVYSEKSKWLKPLGDCPLCTAGQMALWVFLIRFLVLPHLSYLWVSIILFLATLVFFICLSILLIMVLKKLNDRWSVK